MKDTLLEPVVPKYDQPHLLPDPAIFFKNAALPCLVLGPTVKMLVVQNLLIIRGAAVIYRLLCKSSTAIIWGRQVLKGKSEFIHYSFYFLLVYNLTTLVLGEWYYNCNLENTGFESQGQHLLGYQSCCIIINVIVETDCGFSNRVCGMQWPDVGEHCMSMPD